MEVLTNLIWKKYANPWSVWVRFIILPLLIMAAWSRVWIAEWSLVLISLTIIWIWFNPRVFQNKQTDNLWTMQAILGERIWLNRKNIYVPEQHFFVIYALQLFVMLSFFSSVVGVIILNIWLTVMSLVLTCMSMCWFLDRMVWLYNDDKQMRDRNKLKLQQQQRRSTRKKHLSKVTV